MTNGRVPNTKDFPEKALAPYGCEAQHPDTFLLHQMTLAPLIFAGCARRVRARLQNPEHSIEDFLDGLRKAGLPLIAAELARMKDLV